MSSATRKTCAKCAHYTPSKYDDNDGDCELMGDSNDSRRETRLADQCSGWDYEGYRAGVYVGPKFGCIHWTKKETPRTPQPTATT